MPPPAAISLIPCAFEPHLELFRAIASVDEMGVAIDQRRRHPAAFAVNDLFRAWGFDLFPGELNAAVRRDQRAAQYHADPLRPRREGGETRVTPKRGCESFGHLLRGALFSWPHF